MRSCQTSSHFCPVAFFLDCWWTSLTNLSESRFPLQQSISICCQKDTRAGRRCQLTSLGAAALSLLVVGELIFPTPPKCHRWQDLTGLRNECWCCERRRQPNGKGRQSKKGLPRSSTFTSCCCLCWLPSLRPPPPPLLTTTGPLVLGEAIRLSVGGGAAKG